MLPGFCGIFGGKNCRCCRRAFWLDNPNQQCSQLHFARIYPRTSLLPELFTIWAERIGEDVDNDRRVFFTVEEPVGLFHPLPHFTSGGCVNFFFDKRVTQVFTFFVVHVTRDSVLTIWSQVDGDAHILILTEITFHSSRGIERFDDCNTLFFNRFYWGRKFLCEGDCRKQGQ
ncbi:hypothetical protein ExPECSC053_00569 [Escherichia coli]|nr:hypothetical protein ExPECSC053_00569 [Escherichia coli]GCX21700.1 hypothetical protein HmCmsJML111_00116 [Escherichia coli]GDB28921.1 hypothetical protein HmCmsJML188_00306 [Escherichia coli]